MAQRHEGRVRSVPATYLADSLRLPDLLSGSGSASPLPPTRGRGFLEWSHAKPLPPQDLVTQMQWLREPLVDASEVAAKLQGQAAQSHDPDNRDLERLCLVRENLEAVACLLRGLETLARSLLKSHQPGEAR